MFLHVSWRSLRLYLALDRLMGRLDVYTYLGVSFWTRGFDMMRYEMIA